MISVIVSSYNKEQFNQLSINVVETIGVPFEIIKIDNPDLMGSCEAYNRGAQQSKYPILCFIHEDLEFNNKYWGKNLINHFERNTELGLIGVAGSSYKTYIPSGWSFPQQSKLVYMNIKQPSGVVENDKSIYTESKVQDSLTYVATIDGCFMATLKNIWQETKFDQVLLKSYHCYDIDFSLAVGTNYSVAVVNDIKLTHFSSGGFNQNWVDETIKLHNKWNNTLPKKTGNISPSEQSAQEAGAFSFLLRKVIELKYKKTFLFRVLINFKAFKLLGVKPWLTLFSKTIYYNLK